MKIILSLQTVPFFLISLILYPLVNQRRKRLLLSDFQPWASWLGYKISYWGFCLMFIQLKEFRNVVYKRIGILSATISWLWRRQDNLTIACSEIGPGLIIQHGYSTVVCATKIGKNFRVNQCVNIVWNGDKQPTIGDNVSVYAGAIIVGGVTIGNNVIIGAGAVVVKDIPDNSLVVGNPMQIKPIKNTHVLP